MTGGPAIVSGVARGDSEVYEVSPDALRRLLNDHPELGDIILQAFIARRQLLQESGEFVGLRVIGSGHSPETFRVREFLAKNQVPFTWFDTDADPQVKRLLERFGVSEADTPVVAWGHKLLLRKPSIRQLAEALGLRRPLERGGLRPRRGRGRAGGAGRGGLRRLGGPEDGGPRAHGPGGQAGRSMRIENYLGLPHRHHRRRAGRARRRPGQQVRGLPARRRAGHRPDVRRRAGRAPPRRRRDRSRPGAC